MKVDLECQTMRLLINTYIELNMTTTIAHEKTVEILEFYFFCFNYYSTQVTKILKAMDYKMCT